MRSKNTVHEELSRRIKKFAEDQSTSWGLANAAKEFLKELALTANHEAGMRRWNARRRKNLESLRVQIGGGRHILKGFLNIDISPPADLICDVREGIPLPDESAELVFSEHFLEHIDYPHSVKKFVKEVFRILKPSGILIIGVPDAEIVIRAYQMRNKWIFRKFLRKWYTKRTVRKDIETYIDLVNIHFRDQEHDDIYSPHRWAYDREKLFLLLRRAKFKNIGIWKFNAKLANSKRRFGSIYIQACK